jgi:GntR family transcriptional regulator
MKSEERFLFTLDPSSPVPIYAQVVDELKRLIGRGYYKPDDRLPSVRELAIRLRINPNTVVKAYDLLVDSGFARVQKGIGVFVVEPRRAESNRLEELSQKLRRVIEDARAGGVGKRDLHRLYVRHVRNTYA